MRKRVAKAGTRVQFFGEFCRSLQSSRRTSKYCAPRIRRQFISASRQVARGKWKEKRDTMGAMLARCGEVYKPKREGVD